MNRKNENESQVPALLRNGVDTVIYALAGILITHFVFDKPANGLIATSSVITIILGMSARTTLASLFSGLSLNLSRGIKKGDYIVIERHNVRGKIIDMDWRSVTIITETDNYQILPNDYLATHVVLNLSYPSTQRIVEINVLQKYEYSPQKVKDLLVEAALNSPHVLNTPRPQAFASSFDEDGIMYTVRVFTLYFDDKKVINDVLSSIWYTFQRRGLPLSKVANKYDRENSLEKTKEKLGNSSVISTSFDDYGRAEISAIIGKMREKAILKIFTEEEVEFLILNAKKWVFGPPEQIVEQGDAGDSFFFVEEGNLRVYILHSESEEQDVGELYAGDIFGEKAALFGEKRTATVSALTEVKLYEVKRVFLFTLIEKRPQILDELSLLFANRSLLNEEKSNHYITKKQQEDLLSQEQKKFKNLLLGIFKKN
jgi:CRP-like cAMP-binding protein